MKLDVYKTDGSKTGEQVTLPRQIFDIEPNDHVIWLAVTAEHANRRQGTVSTKNRSAVRGGGKKPWRQKGRGTARAGSSRSPLWRGGGRIFGPSPRHYHMKINKKVQQLARKSAYCYKAREDRIRLIEDFSFDKPNTKELAGILKNLKLDHIKTLLLTTNNERMIWLSGRNMAAFAVREASMVSTTDILKSDYLLIQKEALTKINEVMKP
ncbi:MAG TPA: 50S ribosomal protein L4 [bacterium]|nr:50S ribosomal protein L4 [bacterium]